MNIPHIILTGADGTRATRHVSLDGRAIGRVEPVTTTRDDGRHVAYAWDAIDMEGESHGVWPTAWDAARILATLGNDQGEKNG